MNYDVIILGSGISGLLLGSELSQKHSVIIIEKEDRIPRNKYWLTPNLCLNGNEELKDCIDSHYNFMDFIAYEKTSHRIHDNYILWDTNKLIEFLANKIKNNGGKILNSHNFYSYRYIKDGVQIFTNKATFNGKLIIDAMGYNSPFILSKSVVDIKGYYIVFGRTLNLKKEINPICISNICLEHKARYLEVFPTRNNQAYTIILLPEKSVKSSINVEEEFKFIVQQTYLKEYLDYKENSSNSLSGIVPVGKQLKKALHRIYFFGESGQMNPATTGACATRLLYYYKETSEFLSNNINNNTLSKNDLSKNKKYINQFLQNFQLSLFNDIFNWNSDNFLDLVNKLQYIDDSVVSDFLFGDLNLKDLYEKNIIGKLIKSKNTLMLRSLFKSLFI